MADETQKESEKKGPVYEWILFQIKGGGKIVGCVDVGTEGCKRDKAAIEVLTKKGQTLEVCNVHQVMVEMSPGRMAISAIPMDYGDRRIFLRTEEISFSQFMGEGGSLIAQITSQQSTIIKAPASALVAKP